VRTRQPLARALVSASGWPALGDELRAEVCDELNVQSIDALADDSAGFVDVAIKANFRALGQRFAKQTPLIAEAIAASDAAALLSAIRRDGTAALTVPGVGEVALGEADLVVTETPREGWAVAAEGGESLALDLHITEDLRRAGTAREIVRAIQEARKGAGFEVTDRIAVRWSTGDDEVRRTIDEHYRRGGSRGVLRRGRCPRDRRERPRHRRHALDRARLTRSTRPRAPAPPRPAPQR
jgi:isoleucyl-tRNA synthetase